MKRFLTALCLIAMMVSIFAGCNNKPAEQTSGGDMPEVKMLIATTFGSTYDNENNKKIEEKIGVKMNITAVPSLEIDNKLNILMASGDKPDLVQYKSDALELKYANLGVLLPLNEYFDKLPTLKASRSEEFWDVMRHPDGNIYAIGGFAKDVPFTNVYRKDWLDKLGLEVPETIDEYLEVAKAISKNDPDGNGKDDTFAFGAAGSKGGFDKYFDHIFAAYGVLPNFWLERDGELVNGSVAPEAKEALKVINMMYKNGYLDPEFITDDNNRNKEKYRAGVFGAQANNIYMFDTNNLNNYHKPFKASNPDGEYIQGNPLKAEGYNSIGMRALTMRNWIKLAAVKDTKNLDAVLKFLDAIASEEIVTLRTYGVEGEDYTKDGDIVTRLQTSAEYQEKGIAQLGTLPLAKIDLRETSDYYEEVKAKTESTAVLNKADGIMVPEVEKYQASLDDFAVTEYFLMMSGEKEIDGGFEQFVDEWYKRGGRELTDALNKEYKNK